MAHDQLTLKNVQELVEMLTARCEAFLTAYNQTNANVSELMRAQLTPTRRGSFTVAANGVPCEAPLSSPIQSSLA